MKILIVGGTGVLSSAVVAEALNRGIDVTMINRGNRAGRIPAGVQFIKANCNNRDLISEKLAKEHFDTVIDFVCYDKEQVERSMKYYSAYADQYMFISSAAVVDTSIPGVHSEDSPKVLSSWDYSVKKWDAEQCVSAIAKETGLNYTIVRPCVTYDDTRIPYGIAPHYGYHWTFIARAESGKPLLTWNNGENRCNMMRVEDFAVGLIGLVGNEKAYGEAFNICGDEAPSFAEVIQAMEKASGCTIDTIDIPLSSCVDFLPGKAGEFFGRSFDAIHSNSKLKSLVPEFGQKVFLEEGISKTIEAYKSRNFQNGIDWVYDAQMDYLMKKWCRKNGLRTSDYHLGFIDYLGTASVKDKLLYYSIYWQDSLLVKVAKKIKSIL